VSGDNQRASGGMHTQVPIFAVRLLVDCGDPSGSRKAMRSADVRLGMESELKLERALWWELRLRDDSPWLQTRGVRRMTQVCRPIPFVRGVAQKRDKRHPQLLYRMAPGETRERFYPRPYVVEPRETLFNLEGAKELALSSLYALNMGKWFLRMRAARTPIPRRERWGLSPRFGKHELMFDETIGRANWRST
jgi:hypothetical protein